MGYLPGMITIVLATASDQEHLGRFGGALVGAVELLPLADQVGLALLAIAFSLLVVAHRRLFLLALCLDVAVVHLQLFVDLVGDALDLLVRTASLAAEEIEFLRWRAERWMKLRHMPAAFTYSPWHVVRTALKMTDSCSLMVFLLCMLWDKMPFVCINFGPAHGLGTRKQM